MNCSACHLPLTTLDVRLRTELRGICFDCSEELKFHGMTLEEMTRVVAIAKAIRADQNQTPAQARHLKDMES